MSTLAQARGLTPNELEALYSFGFAYLQNGKAAEAAEVFAVLTAYEPLSARYWCALGASSHAGGKLPGAAAAYAVAHQLAPDDPLIACNLAEALIQTGNSELAAPILSQLVTQGLQGDLGGRARLMLRQLKKSSPKEAA